MTRSMTTCHSSESGIEVLSERKIVNPRLTAWMKVTIAVVSIVWSMIPSDLASSIHFAKRMRLPSRR